MKFAKLQKCVKFLLVVIMFKDIMVWLCHGSNTKKIPAKTGTFLFSSASLFSSSAYFSDNENDQRNKPNHQENAPHHASLKNSFDHRTTAQAKSQKANE